MEVTGRYVRVVGRMFKLLSLELGQYTVSDPGDVWTRIIVEQKHSLLPGSLLLMDLLRSVSQYKGLLMVCLYSKNSMSVGPRTSKETVSITLNISGGGGDTTFASLDVALRCSKGTY